MVHRLFTIFDDKAEAYLPPFVLPGKGMAMRIFGDCVNSKDHQFGAHPQDYTLFDIGSFDDRTGIVGDLDSRCVCANGLEVVREVSSREDDSFPVVGGNSTGPVISSVVDSGVSNEES